VGNRFYFHGSPVVWWSDQTYRNYRFFLARVNQYVSTNFLFERTPGEKPLWRKI
jgi:hypothetical protein